MCFVVGVWWLLLGGRWLRISFEGQLEVLVLGGCCLVICGWWFSSWWLMVGWWSVLVCAKCSMVLAVVVFFVHVGSIGCLASR